jgi:hypothetical protein
VLPIPQPSVPLNFDTGNHNATQAEATRDGPSRNPAKFAQNRRRSGGGGTGWRAGGPLPCRSKPGPPWPPTHSRTRKPPEATGMGGRSRPRAADADKEIRRSGRRIQDGRRGDTSFGLSPSAFPFFLLSLASVFYRRRVFFFFFSLLPFFAWLASRVRWWLVFSLSYSAARRTYRPLSNPVFSVPYESTTDPAGGRVGHLAPVTFGFLSPVRPIKI